MNVEFGFNHLQSSIIVFKMCYSVGVFYRCAFRENNRCRIMWLRLWYFVRLINFEYQLNLQAMQAGFRVFKHMLIHTHFYDRSLNTET